MRSNFIVLIFMRISNRQTKGRSIGRKPEYKAKKKAGFRHKSFVFYRISAVFSLTNARKYSIMRTTEKNAVASVSEKSRLYF